MARGDMREGTCQTHLTSDAYAAIRLSIRRSVRKKTSSFYWRMAPDVNARNNDQWTQLEVALLRGCPATVQLLEKGGAKE